MNERTPATPVDNENVIQFPVRPSHAERDDPYSDLGGGLPASRNLEVFPTYRSNRSFFDIYEPASHNAWQTEVRRAYGLLLNGVLEPGHIKQLSKNDQSTVATAVYDLCDTLDHRAPLLLVDGNYAHPNFEKYNFGSQAEADDYAGILFALREGLDEQPVVRQLIAQHQVQYGNKRVPQRKLEEARQLKAIVIDDKNEVLLLRSGPPASRGLHSVN